MEMDAIACEGPVETKRCPLCEKDIELAKFRMHEIGCARANYKCAECGMCVPKAEREEHEEEEHAVMTCAHCGFSAPKYRYKNHDENCALQPKTCEFCGIAVKVADWQDHYNLCGNKTYQCAACGFWVKNMHKATHISDGTCQKNKDKKQEEEDNKQKAELERFRLEHLKEMEQKKKNEERKEREEQERQRKKAEKDAQYEARHGISDFDEFQDGNQRVQQQIKPVQNSVRQNHPKIQTSKPSNPVAKMPANGYMNNNNGSNPGASRGALGNPGTVNTMSNAPVVNNKRMMGGGPVPNKEQTQIRGNVQKPINSRAAPQMVPAQQQAVKPSSKQTFRTKLGNMAGAVKNKVSPKNKNQQQRVVIPDNNNHSSQQVKQSRRPNPGGNPSSSSGGMGSSLAPPTTASTNGNMGTSVEDEINAALIQQMMEEDENEIMANQMMQNDMGGGGAMNFGADGGLPFGMQDNGANVRAADQQQEQQLIGGHEDYMRAPRGMGRHRNRQAPPVPQAVVPESDQQLQEIEAELNRMQGVTTRPQQMPYGGGQPGEAALMGETLGTEQAMLNKVIEDSLRSQQHVPSANYDEEAELARILEASKNDL